MTAVPGVSLRGLSEADLEGALALSSLAGWNQRAEDWRFLLQRNPGRFVGAVRDGRLVGTGGAACYGADLAWVCMILVHPDERRHGIGSALVEAVLERVRDVRCVGLDATPFGQGVYARLGFVETGRLARMEKPRDKGAALPASGPRVRPIEAADLPAVLALDREVFGADRGELLRWASGQAPALCVEEGGVSGYCFGRQGARTRQIGPVVAGDDDVAAALVAAAFSAGGEGPVVVDASADHPGWRERLLDLGFTERRPLVRMFIGGKPPGRPDMQRGIFGPEFA